MGLLARLRSWTATAVRPPFERTVCACDACVSYCKKKPGVLIPSDIPVITQRLVELKLIPSESDIGRVLRSTRPTMVHDQDSRKDVEIRKIAPARDHKGRCVFLDAQNRCVIHGVSPFGCAYFDAHMDPAEAERRQIWSLRLIRASESYQALRETLEPATYGRSDR